MSSNRVSPNLVGLIIALVVTAGCAFGATAPTQVPNVALSATPTAQPTARPTATPTPARTQTPIARLVSVSSYKLYIECTGAGSPTVVMDSGLSANSRSWSLVAPKVNTFTHVCVYDRANTGRSERAPTPRTSQDIVNDLHALLVNAGVAGPYVLVGHSLGGLNVQLYASEYPKEVVGMVLVDSAHPAEWERLRALLPAEQPNESPQLKDFRREFSDPVKGTERIDLKASGEQVAVRHPDFGDMPLVVLSHGKPITEIPAVVSPFVEAIWAGMQRDLLNLSTHSQQVIAAQSGHNIPTEQPQLVIDAIRQVVDAVQRK